MGGRGLFLGTEGWIWSLQGCLLPFRLVQPAQLPPLQHCPRLVTVAGNASPSLPCFLPAAPNPAAGFDDDFESYYGEHEEEGAASSVPTATLRVSVRAGRGLRRRCTALLSAVQLGGGGGLAHCRPLPS